MSNESNTASKLDLQVEDEQGNSSDAVPEEKVQNMEMETNNPRSTFAVESNLDDSNLSEKVLSGEPKSKPVHKPVSKKIDPVCGKGYNLRRRTRGRNRFSSISNGRRSRSLSLKAGDRRVRFIVGKDPKSVTQASSLEQRASERINQCKRERKNRLTKDRRISVLNNERCDNLKESNTDPQPRDSVVLEENFKNENLFEMIIRL